jgi:hypothetical protein
MVSSFERLPASISIARLGHGAILRFLESERIVEIAEGITEFVDRVRRRASP